jgi:hypothetical protein
MICPLPLSVDSSDHLDVAHHTQIFVVEDVAMVDRLPWKVPKRNPDDHRFSSLDQHRVFPDAIGIGLPIAVYHLKRIDMEMGVIPEGSGWMILGNRELVGEAPPPGGTWRKTLSPLSWGEICKPW